MEIADGVSRQDDIAIAAHSQNRWNMSEGTSYVATHYNPNLGQGASADYYIVMPPYVSSTDRQEQHFLFYEAEAYRVISMFLYEDSACSGNMTAVPLYNRDRNSSNTSGVTVFYNPASVDTL
jgi:hypothetical protein